MGIDGVGLGIVLVPRSVDIVRLVWSRQMRMAELFWLCVNGFGRRSCKRRWRLCLLQVATGGGWAMRWILYHLLSTRILAFFAQFNQPVVVKKKTEREGEGQLQRHIYPNDARSKPIQSSLNGQCHCTVSKINTSSRLKWNRPWNNLNNAAFHFAVFKAKQSI
jgi:hypothetical protein